MVGVDVSLEIIKRRDARSSRSSVAVAAIRIKRGRDVFA